MNATQTVDRDSIAATYERIRPHIRRTPVLNADGADFGLGAQPPTPEWGLLIAEGRNYVATSWWLTVLPGLVVVVVVLAANRISHALGRNR